MTPTLAHMSESPTLSPDAPESAAMLRAALEGRGLRFTQQRRAIYDYLSEAGEQRRHPTAEEIFQGVKPTLPSVSLATVYKAVEALEACGLIRKLRFSDESAHYDFRTDPHHHSYCLDSGTISDVEAESDEAILDCLGLPEGFAVESVNVDVEGWCADCGKHHDLDHDHEHGPAAGRRCDNGVVESRMAASPDSFDTAPSATSGETPALRRTLEDRGLRFTQQRSLIYDYMKRAEAAGIHPTAEAVFQGVKPDMPSLSLGTVYKALETLQECGLLMRLTIGGGSAHFDFRTDRHHHARCSACGSIYDVEAPDDEALFARMQVEEGFVVERLHVGLEGRCAACDAA